MLQSVQKFAHVTVEQQWHEFSRPGGEPTKIDPNVSTFAWNASRMSGCANVPPTYGIDFAPALCWL